MSWRDQARPIISEVIARVGTDDLNSLRAALRAAFPFGVYEYHPRNIWLDEIKVQLGLKKPKAAKKPKIKTDIETVKPCDGQMELFGESE